MLMGDRVNLQSLSNVASCCELLRRRRHYPGIPAIIIFCCIIIPFSIKKIMQTYMVAWKALKKIVSLHVGVEF